MVYDFETGDCREKEYARLKPITASVSIYSNDTIESFQFSFEEDKWIEKLVNIFYEKGNEVKSSNISTNLKLNLYFLFICLVIISQQSPKTFTTVEFSEMKY
jgi:hypothetical protein